MQRNLFFCIDLVVHDFTIGFINSLYLSYFSIDKTKIQTLDSWEKKLERYYKAEEGEKKNRKKKFNDPPYQLT